MILGVFCLIFCERRERGFFSQNEGSFRVSELETRPGKCLWLTRRGPNSLYVSRVRAVNPLYPRGAPSGEVRLRYCYDRIFGSLIEPCFRAPDLVILLAFLFQLTKLVPNASVSSRSGPGVVCTTRAAHSRWGARDTGDFDS